ncbi:TetR family transcriptional regulator [Streptosporangium sp. NPDC049376]|uniref:acyl-CoA-like ligand-binding transcription factor n=1 Tax=Streptosporangium sp. NPDC049376 TaxID=3366192 RepID=UPI00379420FF
MDEGGMGRRERRKRATRAALSEAALRMCAERGVANVTAEQVAEEVGVALRTFFNYFSCKEEAVVAGDAAIAEAIVAAFRGRPAAEPVLAALRAAVLEVVDEDKLRFHVEHLQVLRGDPALLPYRLKAFAARERELAAAVSERTGVGDEDLYPGLVASCMLSALRVATQRWLSEPGPLSSLIDTVVAQLDAGLGTPLDRSRADANGRPEPVRAQAWGASQATGRECTP